MKEKMKTVDLNSDIGESFGHYTMGQDEEILSVVSSVNIACGYHAGDHNVMNRTVKLAVEKGVAIGAHPGLPDLNGFGRRFIDVSYEDVYNMVIYQMNALSGFVHLYGGTLHHVKPHGALYNMAAKDYHIATAIAEAVADTDQSLILYGLAGSELIRAGKKSGLTVAQEVFADRTYQPDGTLTPRSQPNAIIHDKKEAAKHVIKMVKDGIVTTVDGSNIPIQADTICVHGDEQQALHFVKELRAMLAHEELHMKAVGHT